MARKGIADFMTSNQGLSPTTLNHLRQLVERYPYFHAARLLYLRSLFHNHDASFHEELRKAALYVPSRKVLYHLIEGDSLNPNLQTDKRSAGAKATTSGDDRTESLIGQFLDSLPEEKPHRRHKVDASVDYIEFLRQNESGSSVLSPPKGEGTTSGTSVIDDFLDNEGKLVLHDRSDDELLKPLPDAENGGEGAILTEVMAKIYIKQQKYDNALEIIQKLSLKYPKKSRYFADQIRFLEKLIINNNNK